MISILLLELWRRMEILSRNSGDLEIGHAAATKFLLIYPKTQGIVFNSLVMELLGRNYFTF